MTDYSKDAWKYYELGRAYNNALTPNQYKLVETNNEFFMGNQWINLPENDAMRRLGRPTFNIIKRVTSLFIANLTSSGTAINFEPLPYQQDKDAAGFATSEVRNLLEKFKMDYRIREALFDGAVTGDYCAHFFWNPEARPYGGAYGDYRGEIEMELVDGINVMFGNPNTTDVERQPYIIIVGRDTVENLKDEAEYWRKSDNVDDTDITPDSEPVGTEWNYHRIEIHGDDDKSSKATYIYLYTKVRKTETYIGADGIERTHETETVHVTKATRTCTIFEDIDTGLYRYPVAWGVWQKQKNRYHGRALVTEVIPNQIFINQMMAMVFRHLQTQAFPTKIFNADVLPGVSNEVGTAIGVRNLMPGQTIGSVISTLPAADMSNQIIQAIELCMQYTKECLGATDAQLGSAAATNTSALMVLQNSSDIPLENTRAGLNEWMEDIGAILLDMMGTYYGVRPIERNLSVDIPMLGADGRQLADPMTGLPASVHAEPEVLQEYDFLQFKHLWFNISVDVGATSYYSEIAMVQTLDNLRKEGALGIIDYLERLPDKLICKKQELIDRLKEREGLINGMQTQEAEAPPAGGGIGAAVPGAAGAAGGRVTGRGGPIAGGQIDAAKRIAKMPSTIQAQYGKLPKKAQDVLQKIY